MRIHVIIHVIVHVIVQVIIITILEVPLEQKSDSVLHLHSHTTMH